MSLSFVGESLNRYDAECHFVHFKSSAGNINAALGLSDGLLVIGFFIEFDGTKSPTTAVTHSFC